MKIMKKHKSLALIVLTIIILAGLSIYISQAGLKNKPIVNAPTPNPRCAMQDAKAPTGNKFTKEEYDRYTNCKPLGVFLSDAATDKDIDFFRNELSKTKGVYYIKYTSRKDALNIFKEQTKNIPANQSVAGNILPASFEVYVSDPSIKTSLIENLKKNTFVSFVL